VIAPSATSGGRFLKSCTPGYYNNEGRSRGGNAFLGAYAAGIGAFNRLLEDWREAGAFDGLELTFDDRSHSMGR
jgi:cyclohexanone monooxygenase